ncbi:MAG TPA: tRNA (5-methylaminomethyl-2-thiouridine)(34)-methyltransferase MnmD [Burkholderiales bacterium]|nr:tRNA (5-methylaminomethyl-2-thiouridine)(34)-methyltransferase MnmD [Burkholderiales bacterium]
MAEPLVPATLELADGTPYSRGFGDVYHSVDGALGQARHVFLAGNGLPERWRARERFVIFEAGFGLGLNFLATLQAWQRDPGGRLHYVAVEKHPFSVQDLRTLHARFPELETQAALLHSHWPLLVPGGHRAELEPGVVLTLFFGDVRIVRDLRLAADAFYLDGFNPAKNPDMWSHQTLRALARLAAPGATAATWSVAAAVKDALQATGFATEKRPGFGTKREMLAAVYHGPSKPRAKPRERRATVVGAGIAGAAVCERLCARGWEVTLVERHPAPAQEASGNLAGAFHPIVTPDDSVFARLTRAAFLHARSRFSRLANLRWDPCGVLQLARDAREAQSQQASVAALGLPAAYAAQVTREEASRHAGVPVAAGGLWFPHGGWVRPGSLADALLDACGDRLKRVFSTDVAKPEGPNPVLATADDALHPVPRASLRRVRGQLTYVPAELLEAPKVVLLRGGMVLPPVDGTCVVGASFDIDDYDPLLRASSHGGNLERLARILPAADIPVDGLGGRVAFRTVARDRLPLAGEIAEGVQGLLALGSRGLIWAPLGAELIASALEGEPLPLEGSLVDALDPRRFATRAAARGLLP